MKNDTDTERFRALIERIGMNRESLARELDVNARELRRMLAGTRPVPRVVLLALEKMAEREP